MASCWRSLTDGRKKLLLLSNSSGNSLDVTVRSDDLSPGDRLTDLDGRTFVYDPANAIDLKAFSYRGLLTGE